MIGTCADRKSTENWRMMGGGRTTTAETSRHACTTATVYVVDRLFVTVSDSFELLVRKMQVQGI